tara:strand:- start:5482 stop:6141 length:660 start_codon:yes stop_codon:yes gene_type:complete
MSRKKITAVIPIREGSQRVPNKNFKEFFGGKNLLELKIESLKQVPLIDEIIVNTDSQEAIDIAKANNILHFRRKDYFASNKCTNTEHWYNIAETTQSDLIMHVPCTAPFIKFKTYYDLINRFTLSSNDSANTVSLVKEYLWLNNTPLNYDINKVQNSQDLPDVMKLTFGISIIARDTMLKRKNVVGNNPMFYVVSDEESVDIDTLLDFEFAQHLYKSRN